MRLPSGRTPEWRGRGTITSFDFQERKDPRSVDLFCGDKPDGVI